MKETIYRLGEYKIIESDTGQLMWEAHFGFGENQKGRCFRKESILFIGSAESYQNGFLKGEFLDDLKKYPKWGKTKFHCTGVGVRHCINGKSVTKEEMMLWTLSRGREEGIDIHREAAKTFSNGASAGKVTENAVYRLQRYEITVGADGQIISKTYSRSKCITWGDCFILENILFIGPHQNKPSNFNKRQFLESLRQLPNWDQTAYFSKKFSLHECKLGNEVKEKRKKLPYETNATKKEGTGNDNKNKSVAKSSKNAYQASFVAKLFAILGSVAGFTESRDEYDRLSHYRFIKSYFSKSIAVLRKSGVKILKKIFHTVALIFYIATSLFVFMIGYLKKQHKRWNDRKK
jgi:hypothetical protein